MIVVVVSLVLMVGGGWQAEFLGLAESVGVSLGSRCTGLTDLDNIFAYRSAMNADSGVQLMYNDEDSMMLLQIRIRHTVSPTVRCHGAGSVMLFETGVLTWIAGHVVGAVFLLLLLVLLLFGIGYIIFSGIKTKAVEWRKRSNKEAWAAAKKELQSK
eukprot:3758972-Rhodomonas_salina.1